MAKILKNLVFGQKKIPPAVPMPDYQGEGSSKGKYDDHNYENIPILTGDKHKVQAQQKRESQLVVFETYSEPADFLKIESDNLTGEDDCDPIYMSPVDDLTKSPSWQSLEEEEAVYCLPYESENGDSPIAIQNGLSGSLANSNHAKQDSVNDTAEDPYDVVPDDVDDGVPAYDEPWEWSVGARLTTSLQVSSPSSPGSLGDTAAAFSCESLLSDSDDMSSRQQRRLYETAFDSRIRDSDDLERLMRSPYRKDAVAVTRAGSRSSFGSTSGSSASSTPTHGPMEESSPRSRHHFSERRRTSLIRDRAPSPLILENRARLPRKASLQWDNTSNRSSSQESMNIVEDQQRLNSNNVQRNFLLNKSHSRDSLVIRDDVRNLTANYPRNWKELTNARLGNSNDVHENGLDVVLRKDDAENVPKEPVGIHEGNKVLPINNSRMARTQSAFHRLHDPESKENNSSSNEEPLRRRPLRPSSLLSEVRPLDNVPQSPDVDPRPSEEYDPPWELTTKNMLRSSVNGSVSVPERLSSQPCNLPSSVTHDKLLESDSNEKEHSIVAPKALPAKPSGLPSRTNLNLNLNLSSDSPRKGRQSLQLNFGCAALCAVGEKVDAELTLEKQGWYHGSISRLEAENLLRVLKEGSYLVRNSESSKSDYSLSLKSARGFMHMKIVQSDGRYILGQFSNPFSSIPEMIHHYSLNKLPIKGAEHMSLLYPVIGRLL